MLDMTDISPEPGSTYIHSMSEAFNEEMRFDEQRCKNWLDLMGLARHQIHASGHAPQQDLLKVANTVNAKKFVPIHTEYPEKFAELGMNCTYVKVNEPLKL
jgi:mRNA degradation ribonuclease J1/J2